MIDVTLLQSEVTVGETLSGRMTWTASSQKQPKEIKISMGWRTEGRGEVDRQTVEEIRLGEDRFSANGAVYSDFNFPIPRSGPVSYDGSLIRIIWEVRIVVDMPGFFSRDDKETYGFRVLPQPILSDRSRSDGY